MSCIDNLVNIKQATLCKNQSIIVINWANARTRACKLSKHCSADWELERQMQKYEQMDELVAKYKMWWFYLV